MASFMQIAENFIYFHFWLNFFLSLSQCPSLSIPFLLLLFSQLIYHSFLILANHSYVNSFLTYTPLFFLFCISLSLLSFLHIPLSSLFSLFFHSCICFLIISLLSFLYKPCLFFLLSLLSFLHTCLFSFFSLSLSVSFFFSRFFLSFICVIPSFFFSSPTFCPLFFLSSLLSLTFFQLSSHSILDSNSWWGPCRTKISFTKITFGSNDKIKFIGMFDWKCHLLSRDFMRHHRHGHKDNLDILQTETYGQTETGKIGHLYAIRLSALFLPCSSVNWHLSDCRTWLVNSSSSFWFCRKRKVNKLTTEMLNGDQDAVASKNKTMF